MKKIDKMTVDELDYRRKLLIGLIIIWTITFIVLAYLTMNSIRAGESLNSLPTFYFMIFIPIIISWKVNGIIKIKKEIASKQG